MDPLSVTASILAVVTAASAVLKQLERVKARSHSGPELNTVINAVTDLQATLIVVRNAEEALRDSAVPAMRQFHHDLRERVDKSQGSLNRLIDFTKYHLLRQGKGLSRLGISGKRRKELSDIRESISESNRNLQLVLLSANLSANLRQIPRLLSAIESVKVIQEDQHSENSMTAAHVITEVATIQPTIRRTNGNNDLIDQGTAINCSNHTPSTLTFEGSASLKDDTEMCITTTLPLKACDSTCQCQCHIRTYIRTPQWLSRIVGTLFYTSSYTPSLDIRPCNRTQCFRSGTSSSYRLTYYFPTWLTRSALVHTTWDNLGGSNASWTIRMPRELSLYHEVWYFISTDALGDVRGLLRQRKMSPYDVDPDGWSVLRWAATRKHFDICALLVSEGADWHFKDRTGRSPADTIWEAILQLDSSNRWAIQARTLLGSDDDLDFQMSPLHRIVTGLSGVDLEAQIDMDPSRINDQDWLGKTPLQWAISRDNLDHFYTLLAHKSEVHHFDNDGLTALHYAVQEGRLEFVSTLLNAKADPNARGFNGMTALHTLAISSYLSYSSIEEITEALLNHGADIEARDCYEGTPLLSAVVEQNARALKAFARYGADVDVMGDDEDNAILHAFLNENPELVEAVCALSAEMSWKTTRHGLDNVLKVAAFYGTIETMRALACSNISPIECKESDVVIWFDKYRGHEDHSQERLSMDEDHAALMDLIKMKMIPIEDSDENPDDDSESDCDEEFDEDSEKHTDEEADEAFEDALEDIS